MGEISKLSLFGCVDIDCYADVSHAGTHIGITSPALGCQISTYCTSRDERQPNITKQIVSINQNRVDYTSSLTGLI